MYHSYYIKNLPIYKFFQIGGEGLNLIGADIVIFLEHDWNPVKDLQATDRAHRIGQKCVVNVYRLITEGSIEQKIMRLQKFKTDTANVSFIHLLCILVVKFEDPDQKLCF